MDLWYFAAGVGMLVVAGGSVTFWHWRGRREARGSDGLGGEPAGPRPPPLPAPRISPFAWGALGWLVGGLLLKLPAAALLPLWTERRHPPEALVWLAVGLLTGVCEVGTAAGLARAVQSLRRASYYDAVAFGVGFGAFEAAVVALDPLLSPLDPQAATTAPVPYSRAEALETFLAPVVERLNTIPIHALACALAVYTVRLRSWRPFWLAFAYKSLVDALPAEKLAAWGTWAMVGAYVPFGVAGVVGLVWLGRRWGGQAARAGKMTPMASP